MTVRSLQKVTHNLLQKSSIFHTSESDGANPSTLASLFYIHFDSNEIKWLSKSFLNGMGALVEIHLARNGLTTIEAMAFAQSGGNVIMLDLNSNNIACLANDALYNLPRLRELKLYANKIASIEHGLKANLRFLVALETIDLSLNRIESLGENDFDFSRYLKSINLNGNAIKAIHLNSFRSLNMLEALKLSQLDKEIYFNVSLLSNNLKLTELDLSFNTVVAKSQQEAVSIMRNIRKISVESVFLTGPLFLDRTFIGNKQLIEVNFSQNNLTGNWSMFDSLLKLERLELRRVGLETLSSIGFQRLLQLKYLDLAFNRLTRLDDVSFRSLYKLEHLDVSCNAIEVIEAGVFQAERTQLAVSKWNLLVYLNLANNFIRFNLYLTQTFILRKLLHFEIIVSSTYLHLKLQPFFNSYSTHIKTGIKPILRHN